MIHVACEGSDGRNLNMTFKKWERVDEFRTPFPGTTESDVETLFLYPHGWVGFYTAAASFAFIPPNMVLSIRVLRPTGEKWQV